MMMMNDRTNGCVGLPLTLPWGIKDRDFGNTCPVLSTRSHHGRRQADTSDFGPR
jgi:hypothetical protein